jgi:hypothetical protein
MPHKLPHVEQSEAVMASVERKWLRPLRPLFSAEKAVARIREWFDSLTAKPGDVSAR